MQANDKIAMKTGPMIDYCMITVYSQGNDTTTPLHCYVQSWKYEALVFGAGLFRVFRFGQSTRHFARIHSPDPQLDFLFYDSLVKSTAYQSTAIDLNSVETLRLYSNIFPHLIARCVFTIMANLRALQPLARTLVRSPRFTNAVSKRFLNTATAPILYSAHAKVVGARTGHIDGDGKSHVCWFQISSWQLAC